MKQIAISIFFIILGFSAHAQEYLTGVVFEDYTYYDHIKTVRFSLAGNETSLPITNLNRSDRLSLTFDDMEGADNYYSYRILHCTKDWEPSDLDEFEYLEGFNGEEVDDRDYTPSRITDYTQYQLTIPNDDIKWTISGNYLLIIYEGDMEDEVPILTRRFMVVEDRVKVGVQVTNSMDIVKLKTHHQINLSVFPEKFRINDPKSELYATVLQNGRWDNMEVNHQPQFISGQKIQWDKVRGIPFQALKDFRVFDFRSLEFTGINVHSIDLYDDGIDVVLDLGRPRTSVNFNQNFGSTGRVIMDNSAGDPNGLRKEYADVIFTLENKWPYENDVYIVGAFTDWKPMNEYKMVYDSERQLYKGKGFLKQAHYNYMYGVLQDDGSLDCSRIEGNWYETTNHYTALIYLSEFGSRFDRLIGIGQGNSQD